MGFGNANVRVYGFVKIIIFLNRNFMILLDFLCPYVGVALYLTDCSGLLENFAYYQSYCLGSFLNGASRLFFGLFDPLKILLSNQYLKINSYYELK